VTLALWLSLKLRILMKELKCVAIAHLRAPHSIVTLRDRGIEDPRNLEGKELEAFTGDVFRRLFPAFAKTVGIN